MTRLAILAVSLAFAAIASAQEIDAPEHAAEHRLVLATAETDDATGYVWIIRRTGDGFRPQVVRVDDGETAVWTGPPGRYEIDLIVMTGDGALRQAFAAVEIGGEPDDPGDPPPDDPPDEPDPPDNPDLDAELVSLARSEAESIDDPETAQEIASVYSNVRDALSRGEVSRGKVFRTLREATDEVLAERDAGQDWEPFRDRLSDALGERQSRGQLETDRDYLVMLASIQTGLERSVSGAAITIDQHTQVGRITREAIHGRR